MSIYKVAITVVLLSFLFSCKKDTPEKPIGSLNAKTVYNHAYQENFENDKLDDITANAHNAYVLIDAYENNAYEKIAAIKANGNEVGGYISIGTGENWRDDWTAIKPYCVTKQWGSWPGEYFIDITNTGAIDVMKLRIDQLANWGCDWVEFDNMDWAFDDKTRNKYNFTATETDAINYYNELCNYVHSKGMKCMAKNTVKDGPGFDGALYESFNNNKDWWDHDGAQSFLDAGKLVIINHYNEKQPNKIYQEYIDLYNSDISYICESSKEKKYIHYNE
jgi:cysteinyl-tRNA synthetase